MKGSINKELERIISNEKHKEEITEILEKTINIKLTDYKYKGIIYLKRIIEYDFSIIKLVGMSEGEIYNIYIKTIKGGEIKKSVFCCWSLLQEEYEYILENQKDTIDEKIINKVLIKDKSNQKYRKKVSLKTEGDIGLNFEVNFIELEDFLKIIKLRFKEELKNINKKEILLIMVTKKELN